MSAAEQPHEEAPQEDPAGTAEHDLVVGHEVASLYWMLPGPATFADRLTGMLTQHRAVAIHLHERTVLGHRLLIDGVLGQSHDSGPRAVTLRVHDASQIESDIAQHLVAATNRSAIGPGILADLHTRRDGRFGDEAQAPNTFLLMPRGAQALANAQAYLDTFAKALRGSSGNVRLVLLRIDAEAPWKAADWEGAQQSGQFALARFNGALSPDEMRAFVGMRMTMGLATRTRAKPEEFPMQQLAQALVAEFAGFDARFAEFMTRMSHQELMNLPESLTTLALKMPVDDVVWRQSSVETGSIVDVEGHRLAHVLHEWHLASHKGPLQAAAKLSLDKREWRAYLAALMPWFEELRHLLIHLLRPLLSKHLAPTNGYKERVNPYNGTVSRTAINDLECNDIVALTKERDDAKKLRGRDLLERQALEVCHKVSKVRNEIAHLRPPSLQVVQELIAQLQQLKSLLPVGLDI